MTTQVTANRESLLPEPGPETAARDLALIAQMMQQGRQRMQVDGRHLILWGSLLAAQFCGFYLLAIGALALPPVSLWIALIVIGYTGSAYLGHQARQTRGGAVGAQNNPVIGGYAAVWMAIGLTGFLGFILLVLDAPAFSGRQMAIQSCAFSAIGFFVTARLSGKKWLYAVALAWWLAAAFYGLIPRLPTETWLAQAVWFLVFLTGPGWLLIRQSQNAHISDG